MDLDAVKVLFESQENAFKSAMDVVVNQFQARISFMEETMCELTKSLELTQAEVYDLKGGTDNLRTSKNDLQVKIQDYEKKIYDLFQMLNYQEDYSRRNNLRISDLEKPRSNGGSKPRPW